MTHPNPHIFSSMPLFSHSLPWPYHGSFLVTWNRFPQSHVFTQKCFTPETIMSISFSPYFLYHRLDSFDSCFCSKPLALQSNSLSVDFFHPPRSNLLKLFSSQQTQKKKKIPLSIICPSTSTVYMFLPSLTRCHKRLSYMPGLYILVSWTHCHPPLVLFWPESPTPF